MTLLRLPGASGRLNTLRLVLDIGRSIDGRVEGFVQPAGAQAPTPLSGVLELVATLEELLVVSEGRPWARQCFRRRTRPHRALGRSTEVPGFRKPLWRVTNPGLNVCRRCAGNLPAVLRALGPALLRGR